MRSILFAAGVALVLAASATADPFTLASLGLLPSGQGSIRPTQGSFVTQFAEPNLENAYLLSHNIAVTPDPSAWRNEFDYVVASTWLAVDPYGPKGRLGTDPYATGWATYFSGPAGLIHAPTYTFSIAGDDAGLAVNGRLGDPVNGDGLSPGFVGGGVGFGWGPSEQDSFQARSLVSSVNGRQVDSLFIGHFVLSDPTADLSSSPLLVALSWRSPGVEAGTLNSIPIDGSPGHKILFTNPLTLGSEIPFHIEPERTTITTSLGTFAVIDLFLVSTGPYPVTSPPPDGGGGGGDDDDTAPPPDDGGGGGGDDAPPPDNMIPGPPRPVPDPAPHEPVYFGVNDIALTLRMGGTSAETLHEMLEGAGFEPRMYSAKEWKKLMIGLYDHRMAPAFSPAPTKHERKADIASLIATYSIMPELTDSGTQDANDDGVVDFADVARILEVGAASPDRLADTLVLVGMDPLEFPNRKAWNTAVKTFYEARILPEFVANRTKKQQSQDRKALTKAQ